MVVDTHCHLDLAEDRGVAPGDALARAKARGVTDIVQIAVDTKGARAARLMAAEFNAHLPKVPRVHWTAGIHPESVATDSDLDGLELFVREHYGEPDFVGLGETGLDYFHSREHLRAQQASFERHLALAQELGLPIILHLRDAEQYDGSSNAPKDAVSLLNAYPDVRGVLHCFTYGFDEALPFVERGWLVSYSGIVTFRNATTVQDGAARLPLENLLVETDAPFLAPVPHRGKTNEPAFVADTLDYVAALRNEKCGEDRATVKSTIYANSQRFLSWKRELAGEGRGNA